MGSVKNKYRGTTTYVHVLAELVRAAQYRATTPYQDIAVIMGLPVKGLIWALRRGRFSERSRKTRFAWGPMLSAVAVNVQGKAGPGFYSLAKDFGRIRAGEDKGRFWDREVQAVYAAWRRPLPE
jgi:hypothetical protein